MCFSEKRDLLAFILMGHPRGERLRISHNIPAPTTPQNCEGLRFQTKSYTIVQCRFFFPLFFRRPVDLHTQKYSQDKERETKKLSHCVLTGFIIFHFFKFVFNKHTHNSLFFSLFSLSLSHRYVREIL